MEDAKKQRRIRLKASLEDQGEYKFETAEDEIEARQIIAEAEKELVECHVNFRWQKEQLDLVKQAAAQIGIPYQTYIKLCVFRQAKQDLVTASSIGTSKEEFELLRSLVQATAAKVDAMQQQHSTLALDSQLSTAGGLSVSGPGVVPYAVSSKNADSCVSEFVDSEQENQTKPDPQINFESGKR